MDILEIKNVAYSYANSKEKSFVRSKSKNLNLGSFMR